MACAVTLVAALIVLNIYPIQAVRRQMVKAAEADLYKGVATLAVGLTQGSSALSAMKTDELDTTVQIFEPGLTRRVLVVSQTGIILYDSVKTSDLRGRIALVPEVFSALDGYDSFACTYSDSAFESRAAGPIVRDGQIEGAVLLYYNNEGNAEMLGQVRSNMQRITWVGVAVFVCVAVFFNAYLGGRFTRLLGGIDAMGRGEYDYQIKMGGRDELRDIAERFNDLSRKLERTEAVRRQFVSDASHELKTPLASIKLLSDSIGQNANISEGDMREFVQDIGEEIQRLIRISESLLSLTRLDSVSETVQDRCEVGGSVKKCAELLRGSCELYKVALVLEYTGEFYIRGTADGLFHVIFNLMENAIKYNHPGGHVWVSVDRPEPGEWVCLTVRDDGIGIPEDELGKVFDRFYRVDKTRARETGGTGLGLSIVQEWAESMGGGIEVESRLGQGTTFRVRLPSWKEGEA